jgi:rSAM-associated Gly-rich repeat protein
MDEQPDRYQSVKSALLELVKVGVGSVVLASSLLSTPATDPAPGDGADPARIEERVRGVRDAYGVQPYPSDAAPGDDRLLAWFNGGWRNAWLNGGWPNGGWRNLWLNGGWPNGGWGNLWRNLF